VDAAEPDGSQRQQTGQEKRKTDATMKSRTGGRVRRVDGRQQDMVLEQLVTQFHRELGAEPRPLPIICSNTKKYQQHCS